MKIDLRDFAGMVKRVGAELLKENLAVEAANVRFGSGHLEPLTALTADGTLPIGAGGQSVQTLYRYADTAWFTFFEPVNIVRAPIGGDTTDLVMWTDSAWPKQTRNDIAIGGTSPNAWYRLGVPAPTSPPIVTVSGTGDPDNQYSTSYVYTYVNTWGQEGPPSDPSAIVTVNSGETVTLSLTPPPGGEYAWQSVRVYRAITSDDGAYFQFCTEAPLPLAGPVPAPDVSGEVLPTENWYPPPDDTYPTGPLQGLRSLPNGALVGFTGREVCFSIPGVPHAWPPEYRYVLDEDIVAVVPVQSGVLVLTRGYPYVGYGNDPSQMTFDRTSEPQACVSARSVVDMGGYVLYASPDGLVAADGATTRVVTQQVLSRAQWQQYRPEQLRAWQYEGVYLGFNDTGGFVWVPGGGEYAFSELPISAHCGAYDAHTDTLYLGIGDGLFKFDRSATLGDAVWKSKEFRTLPINFRAMRVDAAGYPVRVEVYGDGVQRFAADVLSRDIIRLPGGYRASRWQVRILTSHTVERIQIANSVSEIE